MDVDLGQDLKLITEFGATIAAITFMGSRFRRGVNRLGWRLAPILGISRQDQVETGFRELKTSVETLAVAVERLAATQLEGDKSLGRSLDELRARIHDVEYQLRPNGGGSLRDHVNRLDGQVMTLLEVRP